MNTMTLKVRDNLLKEIDTVAKAFDYAKSCAYARDISMVRQQIKIANEAAHRLNKLILDYQPPAIVPDINKHLTTTDLL